MKRIFPAVERILVDICNDFDWNETHFCARLMSSFHAFSFLFFDCVLMPFCKLVKYPVENHWISYWIMGFVSNWHCQLLKCLQNSFRFTTRNMISTFYINSEMCHNLWCVSWKHPNKKRSRKKNCNSFSIKLAMMTSDRNYSHINSPLSHSTSLIVCSSCGDKNQDQSPKSN